MSSSMAKILGFDANDSGSNSEARIYSTVYVWACVCACAPGLLLLLLTLMFARFDALWKLSFLPHLLLLLSSTKYFSWRAK